MAKSTAAKLTTDGSYLGRQTARRLILIGSLTLLGCTSASSPQLLDTWSATRSTDPVTGSTRCIVAAYDNLAGSSFTRTGYLYPFVEMNPSKGLMVGVTSGGTIRVPVGNVLWRVDNNPYRELQQFDYSAMSQPPSNNREVAAQKAMTDTVAYAQLLAASASYATTIASGDKAREMLAEMRAGHSLIFRAGSSGDQSGLLSGQEPVAGQMTTEGLKPYALDGSFRAGLSQCGL